MNMLLAKGCWNIAKGKFKQRLPQWMDDDLQFVEGKENELTGRIQKRKAQDQRSGRHMNSWCNF
jgi:uncharacterized protein YjbJ (UPF0337 family)